MKDETIHTIIFYILSLARPFALRLAKTFRPVDVFILRRKPCNLLPFRLDFNFKCFFTVGNYNIGNLIVKIFPHKSGNDTP